VLVVKPPVLVVKPPVELVTPPVVDVTPPVVVPTEPPVPTGPGSPSSLEPHPTAKAIVLTAINPKQ